MSTMSRPVAPGREEHALLAAPGRSAVITAVVVALTAGVFAAVGDHGALTSIQQRQGTPSRWPAGHRPVGVPPPDRAGERRGAA